MKNTKQTEDQNNETLTISKTIWSETLIETLIISLVANKSDEQIKEILIECLQKGFKKDYLIRKIQKETNEATKKKAVLMLNKL